MPKVTFKDAKSLGNSTLQLVLFFANYNNAGEFVPERGKFLQNGKERLVKLTQTFAATAFLNGSLSNWRTVEEQLAQFASELRFRVYGDRFNACTCAKNTLSATLQSFCYRPHESWDKANRELDKILRSITSTDKEILEAIRQLFVAPDSSH